MSNQPVPMIRPHKVMARGQTLALQLTSGPFSGILFSYGSVKFEEDVVNDRLNVKFDYTIHDIEPDDLDKPAFEKELGDFLLELLAQGILDQNLIFKGGSDEVGENNIIELDS